MTRNINRRSTLTAVSALVTSAALGACAGSTKVGPAAVAGKVPDATVEMRQVQVAYIGSGSTGEGTLFYRGRAYPFSISGLGVGGIGASTIEASGDVFNLASAAQFGGTYGQARYGFAVGQASRGEMWLQNEAGVIMRLNAKREGLMLSLGGDAMVISLR